MNLSPDEQLALLCQRTAEVIPREELLAKLRLGRPLRVKLGLDPTADHVTLGWAVVLRKLRCFQDLGHTAVLIVGDFTAQIGDPSGKDETRPMLTREQVDQHALHVLKQFGLILSAERLEIRRNSEWLEPLGVAGLLEVSTHHTVARMLERNDFAERYADGQPISIREFIYPLLQGYDSVAVDADVEIGGTDQHFNLLVGRQLQRAYNKEEQVLVEMPLIEGTDGVEKMSQSKGNFIGITEPPDEIFGKLMRVPDGLMGKYLRLTTDLPEGDIEHLEEKLAPQLLKRALAYQVVRMYHGEASAKSASEHFDRVFRDREMPSEIEEREIPPELVVDGEVYVPQLLKELGLVASTSEGRRLIAQGGTRVNDEVLQDETVPVDKLRNHVLRVGKRHFVRLT